MRFEILSKAARHTGEFEVAHFAEFAYWPNGTAQTSTK